MATSVKRKMLWPALWGAAAVLLVAIIAAEHFFGRITVGEAPQAPAKVAEARLLPPFSLPAEPQPAPETVSRPLFVPTRRPSPPAAPATVTTMKKGQFVLTGVTVTPELSFAFLKEVAGGKTHSVKKGSQVNGITVDSVEPRRVVLKQGEETEDLPLNVQVPARVAAAPGSPGAIPSAPGMPGSVPPAPGTPPQLPTPAAPQPPVEASSSQPAAAPAAQPAAAPAIPAPATGRRRPWINAQ